MSQVISGEVQASTYIKLRVVCDYSGTSATFTLQGVRTNSYSGATYNSGTFTVNGIGSTSGTFYVYGGQQGVWQNMAAVSGSIPTSGATYSWSSSTGSLLSGSGSITIPAQSSPPSTPTFVSATGTHSTSGPQVRITARETNWGVGTGTYRLVFALFEADSNTGSWAGNRLESETSSSSTGDQTVTINNSSSPGYDSGSAMGFTILGGTKHNIGLYAGNGYSSAWARSGSVVVPYETPTVSSTLLASEATTTDTSIVFSAYMPSASNYADGVTATATITDLLSGTSVGTVTKTFDFSKTYTVNSVSVVGVDFDTADEASIEIQDGHSYSVSVTFARTALSGSTSAAGMAVINTPKSPSYSVTDKNSLYSVQLRLDGVLIGDISKIAQNLTWVRRRTMSGVDEIDFTLNDVVFASWLEERGRSIEEVLRPIALDCRIVRNGVDIVGGFLATMPGYQPNNASANLSMRFDGYLNLLGGVYIHPTAEQTLPMGEMIQKYVALADARASAAGKGYDFTAGEIGVETKVTQTFDGYKTIKDFIADRCDNVSGAGKFDLYFHPDRTYDVIADSDFGTVRSYTIQYPTQLNNISAITISASEVSGFASHIIAIGSGETSADETKSTVITSEATDSEAVKNYGYYEELLQDSSVSRQTTLDTSCASKLANTANVRWEPEITLTGRQVDPSPEGKNSIWIGDTVVINNREDKTGQTSGAFRVMELSVSVSATGAETITPTLERIV